MLNYIKQIIEARKWSHIRACWSFGHFCTGVTGWLPRRRRYDQLYRAYWRTARSMQSRGIRLK